MSYTSQRAPSARRWPWPWRREAKNLTGTDYAVSVTGIAGPTGGRAGLSIGTFYIGVAGPDGLEVAERIETGISVRDANKRRAAQAAIDLLGTQLEI